MTDPAEICEPETLPTPGSIWNARDGRRMRVGEWVRPVFYPADDYWAHMEVLNPGPRQRRETTMSLKHFGTFLQPEETATTA